MWSVRRRRSGTCRCGQVRRFGQVVTELGGNDHLVAHGLQRLAYQVLVLAVAVHFGGVEERNVQVHRFVDGIYRILAVGIWGIALCEAHAA